MARRRFFVESIRHGQAALEGEAAEHLRKALRAEAGQVYEISDNQSVYLARIEGFQKGLVRFAVLERLETEAAPVRLTLLASLVKFDRFEWIVEKATELGVEAIVPVMAARSEAGLDRAASKRLERWNRIALESSQQSRRAHLPTLAGCMPFETAAATPGQHRFILDENRSAPPILSRLPGPELRAPSDCVCLLTGPEGGWTEEERADAVQHRWLPVSLGPQVLRAETACIAGVAVVTAAWAVKKEEEAPHGKSS